MVRRLRIIATLAAVAIGCLFVAMWIRSYRMADYAHGPIGKKNSLLEIVSNRGRIVGIEIFQPYPVTGDRWAVGSTYVNDGNSFPLGPLRGYESMLGFGRIRGVIDSLESNSYFRSRKFNSTRLVASFVPKVPPPTGVIVPYWSLVLLAGVIAAAVQMRWPPRFSTRGMLISVTIVSLILGLVATIDRMAPQ